VRGGGGLHGLATTMAMSSLAQRVATAVVLVPLVLAALFLLPPFGWGLFALAFVGVAAHEWSRLAGYGTGGRWLLVGAVVAASMALLGLPALGFARGWPGHVAAAICGLAALFWLLVAPLWLANGWPMPRRLATGVAGAVALVGAWFAVVELQARSPWLILAAMAVVWIADTAAYFAGRRFGRHKLAPRVSPGKTWEGVYGALAAVAIYALALVPLARVAGFDGAAGVPATLGFVAFVMLLAAVSVVGDLYESMLKRQAGAKDSGTLLPGHGGVLDRIDALIAAMPFAALAATVWLAKAPLA
jgi:phosphatidate cytidylyltransferase